jgi:hypothetical protein
MSDADMMIAKQEVERHARETAENDVREDWEGPFRAWVKAYVESWATPDSLDDLLDHWWYIYDRTRKRLESLQRHVVRWVGVPDEGWTLGYGARSRDLTLAEAQALYESGATIVIADGIGAPAETTRSPLQVERDLTSSD